ncbi:MAG: type II secretion system protein [Thermoguttaceae bacterium]
MKLATRTRLCRQRGFSLLEVVISLFLVGTIMVVALESFGAATRGRTRNGNRAAALLLAHGLVKEIVELPYQDPDGAAVLGPETGETAGGNRAAFDDIDDYNGWSANPPQDRDGLPLPYPDTWTRTARVQWVQPNNIGVNSPNESGVKQVLVTVEFHGVTLARLSSVVTSARQILPSKGP